MDTLGFKEYQDFLGYTGAVTSVFSAIGLIVYLLLLKSMSVRKYIIAVSTTATVAFYIVPLPVLETYAAGWMGTEGDMNSHLLALMMWLGSIACMASIALTTVCLNKITTRRLLHFGVTIGVIVGSLITFYQLVDTPAGEWFQHVLMNVSLALFRFYMLRIIPVRTMAIIYATPGSHDPSRFCDKHLHRIAPRFKAELNSPAAIRHVCFGSICDII